jgi:hypothetical protein
MQTLVAELSVTSGMPDTDPASQFAWCVQQGINAWQKAGEIVVREIEKDPSFPERVAAKFASISEHTVRVFQRIGLKQIHPELYLSAKPGAKMLLRLPYETQEKHLKEPVDLLIKTGEGWETLRADVDKLTKDQAEQVFDRDGIRDAAAQRLYIESKAARQTASTPKHKDEFKVIGKTLHVLGPCQLSRKQLLRIIEDME